MKGGRIGWIIRFWVKRELWIVQPVFIATPGLEIYQERWQVDLECNRMNDEYRQFLEAI